MSAIITQSLQKAADTILSGGVIICPTEGVYGISCDLFNKEAVKRVIKIKERDANKGLIVVDKDLAVLSEFIDIQHASPKSSKLMEAMWPGPHTFVLPCNPGFCNPAVRPDHSMAVRITSFKTMIELCDLVSGPLVSTSANISGEPAVSLAEQLDPRLIERTDLVLALPCEGLSSPTSIYDTIGEILLRRGPDWEDVE